ncbi:hypothetical protein GCM10009117_03920 [Gangjinia marincola]|uniref:Methyltransferase FkbM domain-containing protein n=1 Tax=Gangjinia marincola TaxID=578463 RepID=A0ABN1MDV6_9FLAO
MNKPTSKFTSYIPNLFSHITVFGKIAGARIFYAMKSGNTKSIRVPGFKYPISIRPNSTDIPTFYQIFFEKQYEISLNYKPLTIIDAGANTGFSAIYLANRFKKAHIVAVEAEYNNYNMLKTNTASYEQISCHHNALAYQSNKEIAVIDNGAGSWGFTTFSKLKSSNKTKKNNVYTLSIPDIMEEYGWSTIDVLKLDIEGAEKELFEKDYFLWLPKVKCLVIELHDLKNPGTSKIFFNVISSYDFYFYPKGENLVFINKKLE